MTCITGLAGISWVSMGGGGTYLCKSLSLWALHESTTGVTVLHGGLGRRVGGCHFHNVFPWYHRSAGTLNPGPTHVHPYSSHRRHLVPTLEWHCPHLSLISHQICISPTRTWHVWYRTRSLIYPIFYWFEVGGHSLMRITENLHNIPKRRSKFTVDHSNAISIKSMPTDWSQRNCQRGETCDYLRVSFSSVW